MKLTHYVILAGLSIAAPPAALGQAPGDVSPASEPQADAAQAEGGIGDFALQPVTPNPFEEETRISFRLGERLLDEGEVQVSMRVYNILHQLVAIPVALDEDGRPTDRLENLTYDRPGLYHAHWDGKDQEGRTATAGPYFVELTVGDRSQVRKILLVR